MIDSLTEQVALIGDSGIITMVNTSWANAAGGFRLCAFGVGDSFPDVCRKFADHGYGVGQAILDVLPEFEAGRRLHFEHAHSIPGAGKEQCYRLVLSTLFLNGARCLALTSYEITDLVTLKRRNRELEREKLQIQGEEARRIGRDIHDTTAQELTVLRLAVTRLRKMHGDTKSAELIGVIDNALTHVIDEIRAISFMLHPPSLEQGLVEALGAMARGFARRTTLDIDFRFGGVARSWGQDVERELYRIAQEALANVHRHAAASHVRIGLHARRGHLHLVVDDDGVGMPPASPGAQDRIGVGIAGMRSRIGELAGRFSISRLEAGTRVMASVRLRGPGNALQAV